MHKLLPSPTGNPLVLRRDVFDCYETMNRLWCYDQSFFSYKVCYAQTVANKTPYWMWDTLLLVGIQCSAKAPIFPCCRFPVPGTRRVQKCIYLSYYR